MEEIMQKADSIGNRFTQIETQFTEYESAISNYKDYMNAILENRIKVRSEGVTTNPANKEQKDVMSSLDSISDVLKGYAAMMTSNHLVDQLKEYQKRIKESDQYYQANDNAVVQTLASKNANDEHLNDQELEHLFSQQVRKYVNTQVKLHEKTIKSNVAMGVMGSKSKVVDYVMYLSIVFACYFGYIAFKKLQEQKDSLVI
jgi:hypothetical protein